MSFDYFIAIGKLADGMVPMQMVALGLIILAAQLGGRICRRIHLSEVTGQLLGGALVGPFVLAKAHLLSKPEFYKDALEAFHFFVFVFLGMVAFGIGEELHSSRLKKVGKAALIICMIHALVTWVLISSGFYLVTNCERLFGFAFPFIDSSDIGPMPLWEAMLIGSIGIASAPAVAFVLMNQLRVEGRLRHVLGSVIVLADLIGVVLFSVLLQVGRKAGSGVAESGMSYLIPMFREIGIALLLGAGIFVLLRLLVSRKAKRFEREGDDDSPERVPDHDFLHRILAEHPSPSAEILLIVIGAVSLGCGVAYMCHAPFLITAMLAGFMISNFHSHAIFDSLKIDNIAPVLNLGFFALIGAKISLDRLSSSVIILAVIYIIARLVGKLFGIWIGCKLMGEERKISACLPSLMLPQAGVAAVEAVYVSTVLNKPEIGAIVLPAIVFFEITGVVKVDRALRKWRSWVADEEKALKEAGSRSGAGEAARKLLGYLGPKFIVADCTAASKGEVIENLVEIARRNSPQHIDQAQALQVLGEREKLAPTGFGNGIAIPHCRLMGLDHPVLVLAKSNAGVVFGGVDNKPCHLILLILSSARDPSEHLKLLASAAHVFGSEEARERMLKSDTSEEMLKILQGLGA